MTRTKSKKNSEKKSAPALIAYHVPDRENASWTRIGAAWPHEDGKGFSLTLDLLPAAGGRVVLRNFEPKDLGEGA